MELAENVNVTIANADGKLIISFLDGTFMKEVLLYDFSGRLLQTSAQGKSVVFESNNLSQGMYILNIITDKNNYQKNIYIGK